MIDKLKTLRKSITTMQREGQARQGCLKRVFPRALQGRKANQAHTDTRPTKSDGDSAYAKQTERLLNGKGGDAGRRDSAVLERVVRRDDS